MASCCFEPIIDFLLSGNCNISTFPESGSWLGIKVGNDEEMALRTNLASVPYAFQVADSSIGTDQLKDKSVSLEKILPPLISSVNGISAVNGNLEILTDGGASIIADSVEMTLTISSSGGGGLIQIVNSSGALTVNLDGNDLGGGSVALTDGLGNTTVFLDGVFGDISATGLKFFRVPHPTDLSKEINYVAIEGPEAGMYVRGSAHLEYGEATVTLPEHFRLLCKRRKRHGNADAAVRIVVGTCCRRNR